MPKPKAIRLAAYGLLVCSERVLLCRLSRATTAPGCWTLPGGGLEFGEHPEAAAQREIREETGLAAEIGQLLKIDSEVHFLPETDLHSIRFIYSVRSFHGKLTHELENSTDRCDWFSLAEARSLDLVSLASLGLNLVESGYTSAL